MHDEAECPQGVPVVGGVPREAAPSTAARRGRGVRGRSAHRGAAHPRRGPCSSLLGVQRRTSRPAAHESVDTRPSAPGAHLADRVPDTPPRRPHRRHVHASRSLRWPDEQAGAGRRCPLGRPSPRSGGLQSCVGRVRRAGRRPGRRPGGPQPSFPWTWAAVPQGPRGHAAAVPFAAVSGSRANSRTRREGIAHPAGFPARTSERDRSSGAYGKGE